MLIKIKEGFKNIISKYKSIILFILIVIILAFAFSVYRARNTRLLDKDVYKELRASLEEKGEEGNQDFASQEELADFIRSWADQSGVVYTEDKAGNIIFDKEAVKRKKKVSPTLVCVSMNYETASDNAYLLAAAASLASSDIDSGRQTVVFVNDEQNLGNGYKKLSKDYFGNNTKVIYLDGGSKPYLSTSSFEKRFSTVYIPAKHEDNICDSAVKIKISGIKSGVVGPNIGKQPDPVSALSSLLTRLKSKSVTYRLADFELGSNGNMYPTSVEATIVLNSYAVSSFTGYIDKRSKAWNKAYDDEDGEDIEYTYEVVDDAYALPEKTYTEDTTDKLTDVLYTIKDGTYKYAESDVIPENREVDDVYGINCMTDLKEEDGYIKLRLLTEGYNKSYTDRIYFDNKAAAELYDCKFKENSRIEAFTNDKDSLSRNFVNTYDRVNESDAVDSTLEYDSDNYFTPCSYLSEKNSKADVVHVKMTKKTAAKTANTILCYIKSKGNTSFF